MNKHGEKQLIVFHQKKKQLIVFQQLKRFILQLKNYG